MVPWPDRNASDQELRNYDEDPGAGPEGKHLLPSKETRLPVIMTCFVASLCLAW